MAHKGGVGKLEFDPAPTMDSNSGNATVVFNRNQIPQQGQNFDTMQFLTEALADGRGLLGGYLKSVAFRVVNPAAADIDTLSDAGEAGTDYYCRVTSLDGNQKILIHKMQIRAYPSPVTPSLQTHGFAMIEGESAGVTRADVQTEEYS